MKILRFVINGIYFKTSKRENITKRPKQKYFKTSKSENNAQRPRWKILQNLQGTNNSMKYTFNIHIALPLESAKRMERTSRIGKAPSDWKFVRNVLLPFSLY